MSKKWKGKCNVCNDETLAFVTRTDAMIAIAGGENWESCRNGCDQEPLTIPVHRDE